MTLIFYKILTLLSEDLKVPLIRIVFFFGRFSRPFSRFGVF
jgi:hypothetical protein